MKATHREKINTLWIVFLLGLLFHTDLGLMPLFHNQSVALSDAHGVDNVAWVFWAMLAFFCLPLLAIVANLFFDTKRYRKIHFGATVFYSVLNFFHIVADLMVTPIVWYQIALMVLLFWVGLLLNWVSLQWMHPDPRGKLISA